MALVDYAKSRARRLAVISARTRLAHSLLIPTEGRFRLARYEPARRRVGESRPEGLEPRTDVVPTPT